MYTHRSPASFLNIGGDPFTGSITAGTAPIDPDIGDITIPASLQGSIKYAFLDFNFGLANNTRAGSNGLGITLSKIQFQNYGGGTWHDGLILSGDMLKTPITGVYYPGTFIGRIDISPYIVPGGRYWVRWYQANTLYDNIQFMNLQVIFRVVLG